MSSPGLFYSLVYYNVHNFVSQSSNIVNDFDNTADLSSGRAPVAGPFGYGDGDRMPGHSG